MNSEMVIKISFEGKIKRMSPTNYQSFHSLIKRSFLQLNDGYFEISYFDDENDKIDVDCQEDFSFAIDFAKKNKNTIKFIIEKTQKSQKSKEDSDNMIMPELLLSIEARQFIKDKPIICIRCKDTYPTFKLFDDHEWKCQLNHDHNIIKTNQFKPIKDEDTVIKQCLNCKKDIETKNYLIHNAKYGKIVKNNKKNINLKQNNEIDKRNLLACKGINTIAQNK